MVERAGPKSTQAARQGQPCPNPLDHRKLTPLEQEADMGIERVPGAKGASFSKAVAVSGAGRTVYVSGHLAPGRTMAEQTNGCIDQIEAAMRATGGSLEHVVRITAWLTSLNEYAEYARVRGERFGANLPASAAVQVAGLLQGALIEIDAVAFIPE
jgi:2-iminobutanoate/2-iminopropanoate deaminase